MILGQHAVLGSQLECWTSISAQSELGTHKSGIRVLEKQVKRMERLTKKLALLETAAKAAYSSPGLLQDLATEGEEKRGQRLA